MKLHNLSNVPGAKHRRKRLGCGEGSGHGKTSGRGNKGMKARSGGGCRPGFEGGQMPLYRRLPHRGFSNAKFRVEYAVVNLDALSRIEGAEVNRDVLVKAGLVRSTAEKVKILGDGKLSKALTVTADKFSGSAKAKIEKAGGKAIELAPAPAVEAPQG